MNDDLIPMVEAFQCPGCAIGGDTKCGKFKTDTYSQSCASHAPGTWLLGGPVIMLGLPKGFNKFVRVENDKSGCGAPEVRLHPNTETVPTKTAWGLLNVPVWALVKDGYLFVRTFSPRINRTFIDVVKGGTLDMVPQATNIEPHLEGMD
jgi:hypothetical protein